MLESRRLRVAAQALVLLAVLFFWGQAVAANWSQVSAVAWQVNGILLGASAILALLHLPLTALVWDRAMAYVGCPVPARWAVKAYLMSQLARYVPGGVWDVAGRLYLTTDKGIPKGPVSVTILVEMVLGVVTGALIFLASLAFWDRPLPAQAPYVALAFTAAGLAALHPALLRPLLALAAKVLRRDSSPVPLKYGQVLWLAAGHTAARLLIGVAFYLFAAALTPLDWSLMPVFAGAFVAAWVLGFVVFFAPQGLGVREGVLVLLLSFYLPVAAASLIAVGFRLWLSVRDLIMAAVGLRM
jgi:glycosyltransferase 2 family protein